MLQNDTGYIKLTIHACPKDLQRKKSKFEGSKPTTLYTTAELIKVLFKFANTRLISKTPFYSKKNALRRL